MALRRVLLLILLVLAPLLCQAGDLNALIVIAAKTPRPPLDPVFAGHFQTLLWPAKFDTGTNRILSLMSGVDWRGEKGDGSFRPAPGDLGFVAVSYASLRDRGYLACRERSLVGATVYAVSGPVGVGSASPDSLLMALGVGSAIVSPVPYTGPWPRSGILVFEADSWEQAEDVALRAGGRALIVELPNAPYATVSNFYLSGRGWPEALLMGLPTDSTTNVAGLIRARSALRLLQDPRSFAWRDAPDSKDVAWRWFPYVRAAGLLVLPAGMTLLAVVIGLATYAISLEKRDRLAAGLLLGAVLTPAILMLAGSFDRRFGLDYHLAWFVAATGVIVAASAVGYLVVRKVFPETHPLLAASAVGLVVCVLCDPKWSLLSGLFGYNTSQASPEAVGAFVAYLTGVVAFSRGSTTAAAWFGRLAVAGVLALGLLGDAWWAADRLQAVLFPTVALASGEAWMRWPWLFILAFVPNGSVDVVRHGFAWSPLGCLTDARGIGAVNLFDYVAFAVYPGLWAIGLIALYVYMFGSGFVMRQFRFVMRQDPRTKAIVWSTAGLAAASLFNPSLLTGAVLVAFGALIAAFYSAVWSL